MAANNQQMGASAGLRRPHQQQLSQVLFGQILTQNMPSGGWHNTVQHGTRVGHAMNIITNSFLAMPQADNNQIITGGMTYERDAFTSSPDKATYEARIMQRVNELFKKRQANEQNIHHNLSAQAAQNQMTMNQNMQMRGMAQPFQQGFPSNPQQMQQSHINPQGQANMGLSNNPNGLGLNPHQQVMQMGGQMRPQMMQARVAQLQPQEQAKISQVALGRYNQIPESQRPQMRAAISAKIPGQVLAQLQQEGVDPLIFYFQQQLQNQIRQAGANQPGLLMQAQQRSMNQPAQQLPTGPNGELGPFSNVESIMNQQKAGLMAQEAGQMVVPASNGAGRNATPQPMGSLPGPNQGAGQPAFPHQMQPQFGGHQPTQQLKMDQRAAQSQAQIRAQAQAKQMQGQPGGLNGPGGVSQSPAMNTLNAPVRRAPMGMMQTEGHPQIGQGNIALGQQMMDPRFNQPGPRTPIGPNGNGSKNQVLHQILLQMPPELRQQIMSMPQDKVPEMIMRWNASRGGGQMAGRPQPQAGQLGPGNPMAQSMTQFAPGTNTPGQHPGLVNQQQQLMLQQMNQLRNPNAARGPTDRESVMDNMPVPPKILEQLKITPSQGTASPEVKRWGWLKQLMAQKNLNIQTQRQLFSIQEAQFANILQKNNQNLGTAANSQPSQPNIPQQGFQSNGMSTPQATQPAPSLPQQPPADPRFLVSAQEIQKAKKHEKFTGWTDERVHSMLVQMKMQALKNRAAGQMPSAQPQQPQVAQVSQPTTTAPTPALQAANGAAVPQIQQNAVPETSTTSPVVQGRNVKQPQNNATQNVAVTSTVKTGTKRPMPDDVAEVPNPSRTPAQQPQVQAPPQLPQFSQEQLAAMSPEQRQRYEAMLKNRSSASNLNVNDAMRRLRSIGLEQFNAAQKEHLPDVPMTPEQYQETAQRIHPMVDSSKQITKGIARWYAITHDDARAKSFFKERSRLAKQFADGEKMTVLRDKFSVTPADLEQIRGIFESVIKDMNMVFTKKNPGQQNPPEPTAAQTAPTRPGPPATQPTPLNAANLEKQTQAYIKMHQRITSKGGQQPPAAPTTAQPPFPFGAQSPDGQPTYAGKPAVTQESLQLPKRRKTEAKAGAAPGQNPSSANASPQVPKLSSPEMTKRPAPAEVRPSAPKFTCSEQHCELGIIGLPTEDALRKHREEEHIKPVEDPMKFAAEALTEVLGLDVNGKSRKAPTPGANFRSPVDLSKHGQTPTGKLDSISKDVLMSRQGSAPGAKPGDLIKSIAGKAGTPKAEVGVKIEGTTPAVTGNSSAVPQFSNGELMSATIDPQDLFSGVTGLEFGGDGTISDMNVYRSITPNDTPESIKDSASSEPNSDVSEGVALNVTLDMGDMGFGTWDPFVSGHDGTYMEMGNMEPPGLPYQGFTWDEVNPDFDKPFAMDTNFFHLDVS